MAWNDNLTDKALAIAGSDATPLRVVAGPGTGKTFALMRRIARLIEGGVDPRRILLVTFTRVAADDLAKEIDSLNVYGARLVRKGTLHSFCFSILSQNNVLGLTGRTPRPLLSFEERFLLEDLGLNDFGNYYERKKRLKAAEAAWARLQSEDPGWPRDEVDRDFQGALGEWLLFHKAVLLGELVPIALKYLRDNPGCDERSQFDHVLVDEYQDLNRAEQSLIDLLSERGTLTVIGDEDQSIYEAFRYAHPEGISNFPESHPGTSDIPLDECRRCPTRVVAIASELIRNNRRRVGHPFLPRAGNVAGDIHVVQWPSMEQEAVGIASYVHSKILSGEFDAGKVLILAPRRQFGYLIRDELRSQGHSAHSFFHEEVFDGNPKEIEGCSAQEAFTLFILLARPNDRTALRCWLGFGSGNLRAKEYQRLRNYCSESGIEPMEALTSIVNGTLKLPHTSGIVNRFRLLLQKIESLGTESPRAVLDVVFPVDQPWAEPFRTILEDVNDETNLGEILEILRTTITQPELPTDVEYVRIMSLHKSKGLTADHVIVTGCIEGLIPNKVDDQLPFEDQMRFVEEQRRLFFVAITRPKKTLVLSSVLSLPRRLAYKMNVVVDGDGEPARTISSRFLAELGRQCPTPITGAIWTY